MRATIGITAGDPAGIGLEVVIKSISSVIQSARWVLYTDRDLFERNIALFDPAVKYRWIKSPSDADDVSVLFLRELRGITSAIHWGKLSSDAGCRALAYLEAA